MEDPTQTCDTAGPVRTEPAAALGSTFGRYRLERELGVGGMGVVYVAFDPDLQRRVALKVLRTRDNCEAHKRLVREARAMARLAHANVMSVYETGAIDGRDYVAMELADETLGTWIAEVRPSCAEILDAYVAAGRGLAAAHAAGIVHRDFKPHNVLRTHDGRILVSDFGLAREDGDALEPPGELARGSTPALDELTQSGLVFGTPAYMAPEQWSGTITPATDQFAFCIALWEALAGERPFADTSQPALLRARATGAPDLTRIPRRLRAVLLRGLDADPARRWPSMDTLLAKLQPRRRRGWLALLVALPIAAAVAIAAGGRELEPVAVACPPPLLSADTVAAIPVDHAVLLDGELASWRSVHAAACALHQPQQLTCLDGVLARLAAVRSAAGRAPAGDDFVADNVIEPTVCLVASPPRLAQHFSVVAVDGFVPHRYDADRESVLLARAGDDRCARAAILLAHARSDDAPRPRAAADEAAAAAEACGDDRLLADALLASVSYQINAHTDVDLSRVAAAVARVAQPDLVAELEVARARVLELRNELVEAVYRLDRAIAAFGDRRPLARTAALRMRSYWLLRLGDLAAVHREWADWQDRLRERPARYDVEFDDISATWFEGDLATAHTRFAALLARDPEPAPLGPVALSGHVVDVRGRPVAGATVVAGRFLAGDSLGIQLPVQPHWEPRTATTDAAGAYELTGVEEFSTIVAQHGDHRSMPVLAHARDNRLVLEPTTRISGRVDRPIAGAIVVAVARAPGASMMFKQLAPIGPGGRFELANVLRGHVQIGLAMIGTHTRDVIGVRDIVVGPRGRDGIVIARATDRRLRVVVRSSSAGALAGAEVFVFPGRVTITTLAEFDAAIPASSSLPARAPAEARDELEAVFEHAPIGDATLCAIGITGDLSDPAFVEKLRMHFDKLAMRCEPLSADTHAALIEVPPMKRLD